MGKTLNIVTFELSCRLPGRCLPITGVLDYRSYGALEINPFETASSIVSQKY